MDPLALTCPAVPRNGQHRLHEDVGSALNLQTGDVSPFVFTDVEPSNDLLSEGSAALRSSLSRFRSRCGSRLAKSTLIGSGSGRTTGRMSSAVSPP